MKTVTTNTFNICHYYIVRTVWKSGRFEYVSTITEDAYDILYDIKNLIFVTLIKEFIDEYIED